jgi:hypothetical protein
LSIHATHVARNLILSHYAEASAAQRHSLIGCAEGFERLLRAFRLGDILLAIWPFRRLASPEHPSRRDMKHYENDGGDAEQA